MKTLTQEYSAISALLARREENPPRDLHLQARPLLGGLESSSILHVTARYRDARGRSQVSSLVVKKLRGTAVREATVYRHLVQRHVSDLSPRLLGIEQSSPDQAVLYLEAVRPVNRWPWRETRVAGRVLDGLARLHRTTLGSDVTDALTTWDYDSDLQASAESTLELLERCRSQPLLSGMRHRLPAARRIVEALPVVRRQLLDFAPFGRTAVHGDMHPGNALLRRRRGGQEPALLDWGRARIGSPLEDVVSWLQSLGYWEPEARRRHDTLLGLYLSARGEERKPSNAIRAACWLAGASNALAGALRHHLGVVGDGQVPTARRAGAAHAARDWLRVIRRADAYSRGLSG
ncbi:MAG: phosphotransferase family protein [Gemmatimonadales bacterium]